MPTGTHLFKKGTSTTCLSAYPKTPIRLKPSLGGDFKVYNFKVISNHLKKKKKQPLATGYSLALVQAVYTPGGWTHLWAIMVKWAWQGGGIRSLQVRSSRCSWARLFCLIFHLYKFIWTCPRTTSAVTIKMQFSVELIIQVIFIINKSK